MDQCRMDPRFDVSRLSDACIACISENGDRCASLEQRCEPICDPPPQEDDPFIVDAGAPN